MIEQEIVDYIVQAQKHGLSEVEIKQNLLNVGWEAGAVEEHFVFIKANDNKVNFSETQTIKANQGNATDSNHFKTTSQIRTTQHTQTTTIAPTGTTPDQTHFQNVNYSQSNLGKKIALWSIIVLILLGGGAFAYFKIVLANPLNILLNYSKSKASQIYKTEYEFSYSDKTYNNEFSSTTGMSVYMKGQSAINRADANNISADFNTEFGYSDGARSPHFNIHSITLNQIAYLNIENIDFLKTLLGNENTKWIKINLSEFNNLAKKYSTTSTTMDSNLLEIRDQLKPIWSDIKLLQNSKFIGIEKVKDSFTFHIKAEINSEAVAQALIDSIKIINRYQNNSQLELTQDQDTILKKFLSKFQTKELDLWFEIPNYRLNKARIVLSFPTLSDLSKTKLQDLGGPTAIANSKNRDAKRLSDIAQLRGALEAFKKDKGGYPEGNTQGLAIGLEPGYVPEFPIPPLPADGNCNNYYNTYWYTAEGKAKTTNGVKVYPTFSLTFCLGSESGGYLPGIAKLTPEKIESNIPCIKNCLKEPNETQTEFIDKINKMNFNAEFKTDITYYDFDKTFSLEAPENATDLFKQSTSTPN